MGTISDIRFKGAVIRYDSEIVEPMEPHLFEVDWLRENDHHRGSSAGRNQAHFLNFAGRDMVLRHFRRGGLVGKLNRDLYLGIRPAKSRSMHEFELLRWMQGQGLPVPRPVAAQVRPSGPFYRAALITERITDARPFQEVLAEGALASETWNTIGGVIGQMHEHNVFHSDLNCRNILINRAGKAWLIDFDKCDRREAGPWKAQNLDRLKRSLLKSSREDAKVSWNEDDWSNLMAGYNEAGKKFDGA